MFFSPPEHLCLSEDLERANINSVRSILTSAANLFYSKCFFFRIEGYRQKMFAYLAKITSEMQMKCLQIITRHKEEPSQWETQTIKG